MRFEAVAVDHVDRTLKQAGDILLEARVFEHGQVRRRIDLDHDVDIAVRPAVAARHRAEHGRPPHAARAEVGFGSKKGFKGFAAVHPNNVPRIGRPVAGNDGGDVLVICPTCQNVFAG